MRHIKSLGQVIKKLNYIIPKDRRNKAYALVGLVVIGSMLETLGVSAIMPFIEAILMPEALMDKWYIRTVVDSFGIKNTDSIIVLIGMAIIAVYFIKNLYLYALIIIQAIYRSNLQKDLSVKMLSLYMKRDYEYYIGVNTAEIIRSIGTDISGVYNLLDNLFRFLGEAFTAILISVFIIYTDIVMALSIIIIASMCFALLTIGLKKKNKQLGEQKRIYDTARGKSAYQAIMGFKEIKVSHKEKYFVESYRVAYEKQCEAEIKNEYITNLPEKLIEFVCVAALIGVICIRIYTGADMTSFVPKLAVFALAAFRLLPSVSRMTRYMNGIVFNNAFLVSAYNNFYEAEKEIVRTPIVQEDFEDNITFNNNISIKNLSWNYKNSDVKILEDLELAIKKGESIGIIGASGAGKTTLMDVILGLLKPEKGRLTMDGNDIYSIPNNWAKNVSYVPQSVFLLDDSIKRNVAFGIEDANIDEEKIWLALKDAQLYDFVKSLPEGLETQVGERGIKFSGGQRQRVAIARALYNNPEIIILDEATSALDNETEKAVMEAIEILKGKKTLIIVAHRLSTIEECDKVYRIEGGKAVQVFMDETR